MNATRSLRSPIILLSVLGPGCDGLGEDVAVHEAAVRAPEGVIVAPLDVFPDDIDGDGSVTADDPDDNDPRVYPGAPDIPCDGLDEDGDGEDFCPPDEDGDGFRGESDCDDRDGTIGPLAPELRCDGIDQNCDGQDDCDSDGDGALDAVDLDPADPDVSLPPPGPGIADD